MSLIRWLNLNVCPYVLQSVTRVYEITKKSGLWYRKAKLAHECAARRKIEYSTNALPTTHDKQVISKHPSPLIHPQ